jgi:hypothetical protein
MSKNDAPLHEFYLAVCLSAQLAWLVGRRHSVGTPPLGEVRIGN